MDEGSALRLAALLHDIGKFWQGKGERGTHEELSSRFIMEYMPEQWQEAVGIVSLHHDSSKYTSSGYKPLKTIACADWLSSGERKELSEEEEKGKRKETPLLSIFSEIDIGKGKPASEYYYPIKKLELNKEVIFPKTLEREGEDRLKKEYDSLWKDFIKEVERIKVIPDFDAYFNTLYYSLQKYTWCVPSAVWRDVPDVSLFDHLKTTCAIAACLYDIDEKYLDDLIKALTKRFDIKNRLKNKGIKDDELIKNLEEEWEKWTKSAEGNGSELKKVFEEENKFLLIGGDISGIQKFIYAVASPEEARKGMARRLRGRSFYLNLLNDAIATHILSKLDLPKTNLLWCGGGHFTILAPCKEEVIQSLREIKRDINTHLLKTFNGSLALALDWIEASSQDLSDFGTLKERLANVTNRSKRQKFISDLSADLFTPGSIAYGVCAVCGMESTDTLCEKCKQHEEIGRKIARARYILKIEGSELEGCDVSEFGIGYSFVESKDDLIKRIRKIGGRISCVHILKLNDTQFLEDDLFNQLQSLQVPVSSGFLFLGNEVPLYQRSILDFATIASLSKGADKLGIVKMDVDSLGKIFASGLSKENRTPSRISTLSSMLDLFFAGYLNEICSRHNVYVNLCESCNQRLNGKKREILIEITESGEEETTTVYDVPSEFEDEICESCGSEKNRITKAYVVYSGGDDLLIVGPWDAIIEVGKGIRDNFRVFVCNSKSLNMSASVSICDPKFPIGRGVAIADEHLDIAKSHLKEGSGGPMKNSIALFNECVCWDDLPGYQKKGFNDLFKLGKDLERLYEDKKISSGFIYSLLWMWRRSFDRFGDDLKKIEDNRRTKHDHIPLLKYQLTRTFKNKEKVEEVEDMIKPYMPWIRIPVSWASLRTR